MNTPITLKKVGLFTVGFTAAALLVGGFAVYSQSVEEIIFACKTDATGAIRIIEQTTECDTGETRMTWNQTGPKGDMGDPGAGSIAGDLAGKNLCEIYGGANVDLMFRDLDNYNFAGTKFCLTDFHMSSFENADLSNTQFSQTIFQGSDLRTTNFGGADFMPPSGQDANFFVDVNLSGNQTLAGVDFTNMSFNNVNLTGADLTGADLTTASFEQSDLTGADLTDAILTDATWFNTICPDGSNSADNDNTCVGHL